MTAPRIGIGASGTIFDCPARVALEMAPRGYRVLGWIQLQDKGIAHLLHEVDSDLLAQGDPIMAALVSEILDHLPPDLELEVERSAERTSIALEVAAARVQIVRCSTGTAVVVRLADKTRFKSAVAENFLGAIRDAGSRLGIANLVLAYRRGTGITVSDLTGDPAATPIPGAVQAANAPWIAHAKLELDSESAPTSSKALHSLLGTSQLDVYIALRAESQGGWALSGALAIPAIQTRIVIAEELYLAIELGGGPPTFQFHGAIAFPSLGDARLTVSGDFGVDSFALAADMEIGSKAAFSSVAGTRFEGFSLEDVGVLIGFDNGLTFGVLASFTMMDQAIFGAALLTLEGDVPVPRLVSGAIDPIALPRLFQNVTRSDIEGLDALDIIRIDRLALHTSGFPLQPDDVHQVVEHFNAHVQGPPQLAANSTRIRRRRGGYGLIDKLHMRHYFVDGETGTLSLQPQLYVSEISSSFGSYSVEPGIFFAGTITVLKHSFAVLFSLSKSSGILAYATLDPIEVKLGSFTAMRISASDQPIPNPIRLPKGNLAAQFVPEHPRGLVFFLSASGKDVTFNFDGHLKVLELFSFDARIVYFARNLSIHAELLWLGIHVVFQLDAKYSSLLSAGFTFRLQIDTKALTAALGAVTSAIDHAIRSLHATMDSALASLAAAQQKVDHLRHEIDDLDARIAACQRAIDAASWWKKVFVAIAKGAEIAAYEVAKAGLWTAIGVATEALKIAKLAVETFDTIDTALLELVNAAIHEASRLLFLRSAEISADLAPTVQKFSAKLAFTALGKNYDVPPISFTLDILRGGFLHFLSTEVLGFLKQDLHDVSTGRPLLRAVPLTRSSDVRLDEEPSIQGAEAEVKRAAEILGRLQTRYRETFGEDLAEATRLNADFSVALHASQNALATASQAVNADAFANLFDGLRRHVATRAAVKGTSPLETALDHLDRRLQQSSYVDRALRAVTEARTATATATATASLRATRGIKSPPVEGAPDDAMVDFLHRTEDDLSTTYRTADRSYINLPLEPELSKYFREAFEHLNASREPVLRDEEPVLRKAAITTYRPRFRASTT